MCLDVLCYFGGIDFVWKRECFWEPVTINVLGRPLVRAVSSGLKVFD